MHLDGDTEAVIGGEFCVLDPIGRDNFVPLPLEYVQILRRPGTSHPVGRLGTGRIAGTAGEIDDGGDAQLLRQENSLAADLAGLLRALTIWMKRVSMTAQSADSRAAIGELLLELAELRNIIEHRQAAVRIARIIACAKFDRMDAKFPELFEHAL